jgi:hypothetical protein
LSGPQYLVWYPVIMKALTFNQRVPGSSRGALTKQNNDLSKMPLSPPGLW